MDSRLFRLTLIVAIGWGATDARAQSAMPSTPQIVTVGTGEARVTPDRATILIGLRSRAGTAAQAGADNARRQRAVLDTLRALGLQSDQLSTMNYAVSPEMQYAPNGDSPPRVTGYTVTNIVRADVRKLDDVGRVIDAALAKGANEISGLQFFSSKADSVRRVALSRAVANARADADALASAAGGSLGSLIELASTEQAGRPVRELMAPMASAKGTPIEAGEQSFMVSVTARWVYVGGRDH
jgi:uncharacterized protein YggE